MRIACAHRQLKAKGISLPEVLISLTILSVVMAAVMTGSTALTGALTASEHYSVGQLQVMDYLTLDLRRASEYSFTTDGDKLTLPLTLKLPTYYGTDGRTPVAPQRSIVYNEGPNKNKKQRKKHKVISANYYYHYGNLGGTTTVTYSLVNGVLSRTQTPLPVRVVGRGIKEMTFTSPAVAATATAAQKEAAIAADPMVTTSVVFAKTRERAKQPPAPLSGTTFMREYYYSDY